MIATIAFLSLLLIAGSGGGGSGSSPANSSNLNNAQGQNWQTIDDEKDKSLISKYQTEEYNNNKILEKINAAKAYAELDKNQKNINGKDVKIAMGIVTTFSSSDNVASVLGVNPYHQTVKTNLLDQNYSFARGYNQNHFDTGLKTLENLYNAKYGNNYIYNPFRNPSDEFFKTKNEYEINEALNFVNIISGSKGEENSNKETNSHGVAYGSKISQFLMLAERDVPDDYSKNNYIFDIYNQETNTSQSYDFEAVLFAKENDYKIYNHQFNFNINKSYYEADQSFINEKNKYIEAFNDSQDKTLFVTSTGTTINDSSAQNKSDNLSQLAKSSYDNNSFYTKNLIFVTPLESNEGGRLSVSKYKNQTNEYYRDCSQSAIQYCMASYNDSSYKYLKNSDQSYNGNPLSGNTVDPNSPPVNINMAQAQVTGAAAILAGAWPHLKPETIRDILFNTADRPSGIGSDSEVNINGNKITVNSIYGRGILNLYNAVNAQGKKSMPSTQSIQAQALDYSLDNTSLRSSPIFGDAFQSNVANQLNDAVYLDQYGRDYKASLGDKFSNNIQTNSFNLDNFAFNNISTKSSQINLGEKSQANFRVSIPQYKNNDAKNANGLKFAVVDRATNNQANIANNSSFAFSFNPTSLKQKVKLGFAFNTDEIANSQAQDFSSSNFISQGNSFNANPYQNFLNSTSKNNNSLLNPEVRRFSQAFVQNDIIKNKLAMNFSYTNSFDNNSQNLSLGGKKQNQTLNFGLDLKPHEGSKVSVTVGQLKEFDNNMLNSKANGAFENIGNSKTSFVKVATSQNIADNLNLLSTVAEGVSQIQGNNRGVFRNYENVHSRSMSFALQYDGIEKNKFGVAYSEPMRVYKGKVNYDIAVGVDEQANVIRKQGSASLIPNGKQKDYEFYYQHDLDHDSQIRLNMLMQKELNNYKSSPTNYVGYLSYSSNF
ncbi:hypothetical protein LBMAG18_11690 [Alphaproteobacteria bacterium]|nr:hypothetical protein LBMAG18_11690 [Alphaproteobacteria bacterium]